MQSTALNDYVAAAIEHGETFDSGDYRRGNKVYDREMAALAELRKAPDKGAKTLSRLLHHANDWVKLAAATNLLPLNEGPARAVLKYLASGPTYEVSFQAKWVLKEWNAGSLRDPLPVSKSLEPEE